MRNVPPKEGQLANMYLPQQNSQINDYILHVQQPEIQNNMVAIVDKNIVAKIGFALNVSIFPEPLIVW